MITTTCLNSASREFVRDFPAAELSDYCERENNVVWADVSDPTSQDFLDLAEAPMFGSPAVWQTLSM